MFEWFLESQSDTEFSITIPLVKDKEYKVGRNRQIDVVCTSPLVSRQHAVITVLNDNTVFIRDTNSSNGIYINDEQIPKNEDYQLKDLDLIGVGAPTHAEEPKKDFFKLHKRSTIKKPKTDSEEQINTDETSDIFSGKSELGISKNLKELKLDKNEAEPMIINANEIKKEIKKEQIDKYNDLEIIEIEDSDEEIEQSKDDDLGEENDVKIDIVDNKIDVCIEGKMDNENLKKNFSENKIETIIDISDDNKEIFEDISTKNLKIDIENPDDFNTFDDVPNAEIKMDFVDNALPSIDSKEFSKLSKEPILSIAKENLQEFGINFENSHPESDDEIFPASQLFDDCDFIKKEPVEEPVIPKEEPEDDEEVYIKREVFDHEFDPPICEIEDSEDEDCVKWYNKLSQSQGNFEGYSFSTEDEVYDINGADLPEAEAEEERNYEEMEMTGYNFANNLEDIKSNFEIKKITLKQVYDEKKEKEKEIETSKSVEEQIDDILEDKIGDKLEEKEKEVERIEEQQDKLDGMQLNDKIEENVDNIVFSSKVILERLTDLEKKLEKKTTTEKSNKKKKDKYERSPSPLRSPEIIKKINDLFGEKSPDKEKEEEKPRKKETKKYVKPPIIDAPVLKKGKRKAHEAVVKPPEVKELKRKIVEEDKRPVVPAKKPAPSNQAEKAIRLEFQKRSKTNKRNKRSNSSIDSDTKQQIKEDRKKKLKEISDKHSDQKENNLTAKIKSTPKVKVSSSRGLFLTDEPELEPPKKKFIIPKKKTDTNDNIKIAEKVVPPQRTIKLIDLPSTEVDKSLPKPVECDPIPKLGKEKSDLDIRLSKSNIREITIEKVKFPVESPSEGAKTKSFISEANIDIYKSFLPTLTTKKSCLKPRRKSLIESVKKSVTFKPKDLAQIQYFEIPPGNKLLPCKFKDAPIPGVAQKPKEQFLPNEEDALLNILSWVPKWLEEQKHQEISPKVSNLRPMQMLHTFNSVVDYNHIVSPLLLLELWNSTFREWQHSRRNSITCDILEVKTIGKMKNNFQQLVCMSFLSKKEGELNMFPNRGDLIILEIMLENDKNEYVQKFGYVTNSFKKRINRDAVANHRLSKLKKGQVDSSVTFTIHTKPISEKFKRDKIIRIRAISYIAPCLRIFKSVAQLKFSPLCNNILKPTTEGFQVPKLTGAKLAITDKLDPDQLTAVLEACQIVSRPVPGIYMIQGPPGTGKSLVITNIIRQLLYGDRRPRSCILLCAPSNGAIDEITIRLLELRGTLEKTKRFKMLRMGPHNSIHPKVRDISLQSLVKKRLRENRENTIQDNDLLKVDLNFRESKINTLQNTLSSLQANGKDTQEIEKQLQKAKDDLQLFYTRNTNELSTQERMKQERKAEADLLERADIICTTLSSSMGSRMEELYQSKKLRFSCCIVDEATQSNEQETLMPLTLGITRLILVGDPAQLPATVLSQEAKNLGYGQSLFARIQGCLEHLPGNPIRVLQTQYRMNAEICRFPNQQFYGGKLKTPPNLSRDNSLFHPYRIFSLTTRGNYNEETYLNVPEANFVLLLTHIILSKSKMNIGIITPYAKQKNYIMSKFEDMMKGMKNPRVGVNTVDGFQGQERDVIIFSPVRFKTNGFLSDHQRINVSFTRAKYALFVCAQEQLFKTDHIWKQVEIDAFSRKCICRVHENDMTNENLVASLIMKNRQ